MPSSGPRGRTTSSSASSASSSSSSSHAAFASVDSLVSKPVLGSDNTASWQSFRNEVSSSSANKSISTGSAPILPVKRADKLGTGLKTREDEIRHENEVRAQAGDAGVGSGYTFFKRKADQNEIAEKKRAKLIADRVRPDEKRYFIASETFDGWKEDYVFTTRDRVTGYYWDGMDSVKKHLGLRVAVGKGNSSRTMDIQTTAAASASVPTDDEPKKKKRKKKKSKFQQSPSKSHIDETNNPMDQIAEAIRRRNESMMYPPGSRPLGQAYIAMADTFGLTGSGLGVIVGTEVGSSTTGSSSAETQQLAAKGWEKALDPSTNKHYYFNRSTGERKWDNPLLVQDYTKESTTQTANVKGCDESSVSATAAYAGPLPDGWAAAQDSRSGKNYYYHASSGKTQWTKPSS